MRLLSAALLLAVGLGASSAMADTVIFSDNFNTENGGVGQLNYNSFAQWNVNPGTVDLIGNGFFDFYPGNGLYVDLDGSTSTPGTMTTLNTLGLVAGELYRITFDLGGSARNDGSNSVDLSVTIGQYNETFTLANNAPLATVTRYFTASADGNLVFAGTGVGDNQGLILDNIEVTLVPLPNGVALGALGLGVTGLVARRRAAARRLA